MAKRKKDIPKEETSTQRFKRVVEPRVGKALKAIGLVGSVTGAAYSYTEKDVDNISFALADAVNKAVARLRGVGDKASGFTL